jgi:phage-related protein
MRRWPVEFFADDEGSQPVRDWLDSLPEGARGRMLARIDLLAEHGPALDFPFTSQIEGRLREIRLRVGRVRYRVLYFFDRTRTAILLHGFAKRTEAVEEADKQIGRSRMDLHGARLEKQSRRGSDHERGRH